MDMLKSFKGYLEDNTREYNYRIKTISELTEKDMEYIERVLKKYVLIDITKPTKTIIQKHPLDFQNVKNAEVWIVDITTALPASEYILQQELKLALKLSDSAVVVRAENNPLEVYTQQMNAKEENMMVAQEEGLSPAARLSTDSSYDKDELGELEEPIYGDEYNKKFRESLAKVAASRQYMGYDPSDDSLNVGGEVADPEIDEDAGNFNDHIDDAPKPEVTNKYVDMLKNLRKESEIKNPRLSTKSNYDDDEISVSGKYEKYKADNKVETVIIKNERKGIRKP